MTSFMLSLGALTIPEKYKPENFEISNEGPSSASEGPSSGYYTCSGRRAALSKRRNSPFSGIVASLPTKACYYRHYTGTDSSIL